jgi:hypothetical protein
MRRSLPHGIIGMTAVASSANRIHTRSQLKPAIARVRRGSSDTASELIQEQSRNTLLPLACASGIVRIITTSWRDYGKACICC